MIKLKKLSILSFAAILISGITARPTFSTKAVNENKIVIVKATDEYINNYYNSISESLNGDSLKSALSSVLKSDRSGSFSYKTLQDSAFPYTDTDPNDPYAGKIVGFYSNETENGYVGMNKEHTWPNSHGGNRVENDPHVIRPTFTDDNTERGNQYYAESPNPGWDPGYKNVKYRGISARIILYAAIVGDGLVIEDVGREQGAGTSNKMGKLGDLLKWNLLYPVDQSEIIRNESLDQKLGWNRNPFIDRPEYGCKIWGNTNDNTKAICASSVTKPTSINITNGSPVKVNIGDNIQLNYTVNPAEASRNVTWSSANTSIATVSATGLVTPVTVGTTSITVRSSLDTNVSTNVSVQVTNDPISVTSVKINNKTQNLAVNTTLQLNYEVLPSNATNKAVTFTSSNENVATISATGLISARALGITTIKAKTADGNFEDSFNLNIVDKLPLTAYTANFANGADNNTGSNISLTAFNEGGTFSGYTTTGFGADVVKSIDSQTNVYFPRGSGVALGSSGNSGTLKFTFNDDFYVSKVDLTFNLSGQGDTLSAVSGSSSATVTTGTLGTDRSNPSNGTPYEYTFSEPSSYLEIKTSRRLVLQKIVVYVGTITGGVAEAADTYAETFLNSTAAGCISNDPAALASVWPSLEQAYLDLEVDTQTFIRDSRVNSEGSVVEQALARYILIINRYHFNDFIYNSQNSVSDNTTLSPGSSLGYLLIIAANLVAVSVLASYFIIRNNKKNRTSNKK